jgi:hypothetical protein
MNEEEIVKLEAKNKVILDRVSEKQEELIVKFHRLQRIYDVAYLILDPVGFRHNKCPYDHSKLYKEQIAPIKLVQYFTHFTCKKCSYEYVILHKWSTGD